MVAAAAFRGEEELIGLVFDFEVREREREREQEGEREGREEEGAREREARMKERNRKTRGTREPQGATRETRVEPSCSGGGGERVCGFVRVSVHACVCV